jgi:MoaA/NifB/PqqE/SkfB family radical SAM enzyme
MNETSHRILELPILILYPHSRCNCRCVMCDIWRVRQVREITDTDLEPHLASMRALNVKWIVFSGGEPLMHRDLPSLCRMLRRDGVRLSLLSAGLSLEKHAGEVAEWMDDVIVSLDGPPEIHDAIRAVPEAFRRLERGVNAVRDQRPEIPIRGRCTVQKYNFRALCSTIRTAHELKLNSISFLAADVSSAAFNRPEGWTAERQQWVALNEAEVNALDLEIESLLRDYPEDLESGFVVESAEKLRRISLHFRAHIGRAVAVSPRCNAPWVSAVVESDGTVRPCFFHRPIGNIHDRTLVDVLNGNQALEFRRQLDVANDPTCRNCVCSLFVARA